VLVTKITELRDVRHVAAALASKVENLVRETAEAKLTAKTAAEDLASERKALVDEMVVMETRYREQELDTAIRIEVMRKVVVDCDLRAESRKKELLKMIAEVRATVENETRLRDQEQRLREKLEADNMALRKKLSKERETAAYQASIAKEAHFREWEEQLDRKAREIAARDREGYDGQMWYGGTTRHNNRMLQVLYLT